MTQEQADAWIAQEINQRYEARIRSVFIDADANVGVDRAGANLDFSTIQMLFKANRQVGKTRAVLAFKVRSLTSAEQDKLIADWGHEFPDLICMAHRCELEECQL